MKSHPAVITGLGVIASIGTGKEEYFASLKDGRCGIGEVDLFDTSAYRGRPGAEIKSFDHGYWKSAIEGFTGKIRSDRLSRCDWFGLAALVMALKDSGIDIGGVRPDRIAVIIGSGAGGLLSTEIYKRAVFEGRKPRPSLLVPFSSPAFGDCVALMTGAGGIRATISTACSSSSTAIGMAGEVINKGLADIVITGGSESLSETTFSGFNCLRAVDEVPCRPFDRERKGISLGEGAAIFVVQRRGDVDTSRKIYAEIAGYGITADAHHVTAPAPDGLCIAHAMRAALDMSEMNPDEIGYINAHGTGTQANDAAETNAIKAAFGKRAYDIPVSSTKSMIGHCLGAAGALEAAAALMALETGVLPPTANYSTPDPECDLDYVPVKSRSFPVKAVMSNSLAFGGNNTALVLRAVS